MKLWIKYLITFLSAAILTLLVFFAKDLRAQTSKEEIIKIICDGFTITGILFLGFGALVFCASEGAFYGITYALHLLFTSHNWSRTSFKERKKSYSDYVLEKREKARPTPKYILVVGLLFLLIAVVFLIIFNNL